MAFHQPDWALFFSPQEYRLFIELIKSKIINTIQAFGSSKEGLNVFQVNHHKEHVFSGAFFEEIMVDKKK